MGKTPNFRWHSGTRVRCAIYTRKSSEEGLEQAFNSLDAQRETCEAYVLSQKHEGWVVLPEMYDDGGISGGTLERPALQRLLADIAAGKVDTVVVYKVDRLTRSLADFAKIVDVFEKHGVTFVSVTQSFNTTTSMGRLTLNMLLSFAQFEREVAGERIRDKIAASKKKGMWMGGLPPLGYDVEDRKLVVNEAEAETVRHIFGRYAELGSVRALQDELATAGILSKRRTDRFGRETGSKPLSRGALYLMLQNRIYRGEIVHKDGSYPGQHEAIIDESLWDEVQARLKVNRVERQSGARAAEPSLLVGLVFDERGQHMTPTHSNKKGTRYRYYVSHDLIRRRRPSDAQSGWRVPAGELEALVERRILAFLGSEPDLHAALESLVSALSRRLAMVSEAVRLVKGWPGLAPSDRRALLQQIVQRIEIGPESIKVALSSGSLMQVLGRGAAAAHPNSDPQSGALIILSIPIQLRRAGKEMRLLVDGHGDRALSPDRSLLRLLGQANHFRAVAMRGNGASIGTLAAEVGVSRSYFMRALKLSFLSPTVVAEILEGRQPAPLTAASLTRLAGQLSLEWTAQAQQLSIR